MKLHVFGCALGVAALFPGCAESPKSTTDDFGYNGTGIEFKVSPLTLDTLGDACYSFAVINGASQLVVGRGPSVVTGNLTGVTGTFPSGTASNAICASQFGNTTGGDISYVAPCDADEPNHTVRLWVNKLCASGQSGQNCTQIQDYVNPCPTVGGCSLPVTCVENADVPVVFNFTIMGQADQGFFDIAVNFSDVFCSAKLDTCYGNQPTSPPIRMLFDPISQERINTAVLALACTAGADAAGTYLHMGNVVVTCNGTTFATLDLSTVTQEGNQPQTPPGTGVVWGVYYGSESLMTQGTQTSPSVPWNKQYFNVAVANFGPNCSISWSATASDGPNLTSATSTGASTYNSYPVINYNDTVTGAGGVWLCDQNELNLPGSGVTTTPTGCTTPGGCLGDCATLPPGASPVPCDEVPPPVELGCPDGQGVTVITQLSFAGDQPQPAVFTAYIPPNGVAGGQPAYSIEIMGEGGPATISATYSTGTGWTLISDPPGPAILTVTHPTLVGAWADFTTVTFLPGVELVGVTVACGGGLDDYICVDWHGTQDGNPISGAVTLYETSYGLPANVAGWGLLGGTHLLPTGPGNWVVQLEGTVSVATSVPWAGNPVPGQYTRNDSGINVVVDVSEGPCQPTVALGCQGAEPITLTMTREVGGTETFTYSIAVPMTGTDAQGVPTYGVSLLDIDAGTLGYQFAYDGNNWQFVLTSDDGVVSNSVTYTQGTLTGLWSSVSFAENVTVACGSSVQLVCGAVFDSETGNTVQTTLMQGTKTPGLTGFFDTEGSGIQHEAATADNWSVVFATGNTLGMAPGSVNTGSADTALPLSYVYTSGTMTFSLASGPCVSVAPVTPLAPHIWATYGNNIERDWRLDTIGAVPPGTSVTAAEMTWQNGHRRPYAQFGNDATDRMDAMHDVAGNRIYVTNANRADGFLPLRITTYTSPGEVANVTASTASTTVAWGTASGLTDPGNLFVANGFIRGTGLTRFLAAQTGTKGGVSGMHFYILTVSDGGTVIGVVEAGSFVPTDYPAMSAAWAGVDGAKYRNFWLDPASGEAFFSGPGFAAGQSAATIYVNRLTVNAAGTTVTLIAGPTTVPSLLSFHGLLPDGDNVVYSRASADGDIVFGVRDIVTGTVDFESEENSVQLGGMTYLNFSTYNPGNGLWAGLFPGGNATFRWGILGTNIGAMDSTFSPASTFSLSQKYEGLATFHP